MRVSSGMIFDAGVSSINRQAASLLHVQQQVASGQRILTPSEDPVAAARALEVSQSSDVVAQFKRNQDSAMSALGLQDAQLSSASDLLGRIRELAVQAGNTNLSTTARAGIATELRSHFDELVGIANATDGNGQKMFSGFMGDTTPFGGSVDNILAGNEIVYQGDDGQRKLQVSPSRFIEVSDSGNDVFKRIKNGNGYFTADYAGGNAGTGVLTSGAVTNPAAWNATTSKNVDIRFTVALGVTTYDLVDTVSGTTLAAARAFQPGQPIVLSAQGAESPFDLGASVTISGAPADGDSFSIAPSSSQSVFVTLANLVGTLETPIGTPAANTKFLNDINVALTNIDQANQNVLRIRAGVGSRMNEVQSLGNLTDSLSLQYQKALSNLQDVDYTKAVTDLTRNQINLQAAQQSFAKISQLSLFNYI